MTEYLCKECGKQIWAINEVKLKPGVEEPALLHSVCFERLKEFEWMYKDLCK